MEFSKKFVCEDTAYSSYAKNIPAPLFRKSFIPGGAASHAEILICGLGFYDLFINGTKITKGYLAPYISNSDHICYYDRYDLLPYLKSGENVIGVMLGDGHQNGKTNIWNFVDNVTNSAPLLALTLEIDCDEQTLHFEADDFLCTKGPILFNDLRSGVFYDARLEKDGWNAPGFDDADWHKPILDAYRPRGTAKLCDAEPIRVYREIKPLSVTKSGLDPYKINHQTKDFCASFDAFETAADAEGGYLYDFGENNAGIFRLKIKGKRGQKVSLQCGEQLVDGKLTYSNIDFYPDGFSQRDIYYLKGEGEEIFEPMFTYHGCRYVYVSGITAEQATEDLLTYLIMSSDLEERGNFECSDDIANQIYQMVLRSDKSNFVYFPTDCPHREKNGWTGDASVSAEHMILTRGVENSWREWLHNIRAAQKEDGQIPGIIPTDSWGYAWGNGPLWDSVLFNLPYLVYQYRGETDIIRENAAAMLRYLEYVSCKRNEKGLTELGLGDWLPAQHADGSETETSLGFVEGVTILDICRKSAEMFDAVGLPLHKAFAETLGNEMLEAVRREYIDFNTYVVDTRSQTAQAAALFFDVFRAEEKEKAFRVLLDVVHEDGDNFTCGHFGLRILFHVLAEFGEADLAYHMITKADYPSYGNWILRGETTLLEQFMPGDGYYHRSKNHHFFGDVANWFISRVGGIRVQNANEVRISPAFVKALDHCRASHRLPNGEVSVSWERKDGKIALTVTKPERVKCIVETENGSVLQSAKTETYFFPNNV